MEDEHRYGRGTATWSSKRHDTETLKGGEERGGATLDLRAALANLYLATPTPISSVGAQASRAPDRIGRTFPLSAAAVQVQLGAWLQVHGWLPWTSPSSARRCRAARSSASSTGHKLD